jgi:hypothetical protein
MIDMDLTRNILKVSLREKGSQEWRTQTNKPSIKQKYPTEKDKKNVKRY